MIVVDSSALLAICFQEPEYHPFVEAILSNDAKIGAPTVVEASMVIESRWADIGRRELDRIIGNLALEIISFDAGHAAAAREAFRRYGKGRHRAALNFGDCCAYGLAKALGLPLLFKGDDFALTDVKRAI